MKFTSTLAAAAGVVATAQAQYFSVISARSASPIHLRPLQARNYGIWIGGEAATYCPEVAAPSCPNTTYTNVCDEIKTLPSLERKTRKEDSLTFS